MSVPLDAREILGHLNQLGYRNITPEQLKEFQKDLRKLIKFDTRMSGGPVDNEVTKQMAQQMPTFQRLHTLTTISYNAKTRKQPASKPQSSAQSSERTAVRAEVQKDQRASTVHDHQEEKENLPACRRTKKQNKDAKDSAANKMWIRPRSTSATNYRKNDPVSLYHAYQKDWVRFKNQLPGENSHSDLRWQVRTKLLAEK